MKVHYQVDNINRVNLSKRPYQGGHAIFCPGYIELLKGAVQVYIGPLKELYKATSVDLSFYNDRVKRCSRFVGDRDVDGQCVFSMCFFLYIFD